MKNGWMKEINEKRRERRKKEEGRKIVMKDRRKVIEYRSTEAICIKIEG